MESNITWIIILKFYSEFQDIRPFDYVLVEPPKKSNGNKNDKESEKGKNPKEDMAEALRDLKISWLTKLGT